jgi:hypothetical protein
MKKILLLLILFFLISCDRKEIELEKLGNGYFLKYTESYYIMICNNAYFAGPDTYSIIIKSHIMEYAFDSTYIFISQKPFDSLELEKREYLDYNESKKYFKNIKFKQYWIIEKISEKRYGPFNYEQYVNKKLELGIKDSLKFISTDEISKSY